LVPGTRYLVLVPGIGTVALCILSTRYVPGRLPVVVKIIIN